jgi:short-subunit dehydrogenase
MRDLNNKVAVVTGAASGIGRMLAVNLASKGCRLALLDMNEKGLQATRDMIENKRLEVSMHVADVSDREQMYKLAEIVVEKHGQVDIVINNAGVTVADTLENVSYKDFEWVMDINFWGVVYGTKAFLPYLKVRPEARIVNVSSINGFIPFPNNGPYNCSKFAVKAFNETLLQELKDSNVKVISVHPGFIKTDIVKNARFTNTQKTNLDKSRNVENFEKLTRTSAERAAEVIVSGMIKNKRRLLVGADAHVFDMLTRLLPKSMVKLTARLIERSS